MKEHSREGERRREMGGALREGGCAPLDPPLHFERGTRASLAVAVDPSLIRKAELHTSVSHCSMDSKHGRDE